MKVEMMYIRPIFLWSVVVSQAPMPRRGTLSDLAPDASPPGRATTGGAAVTAMASHCSLSLEGFQIGDDVGCFLVCQPEVGHDRAGFESGRVHDPRLEIIRTVV